MLKIGLTGGIGSGKSTVINTLKEYYKSSKKNERYFQPKLFKIS